MSHLKVKCHIFVKHFVSGENDNSNSLAKFPLEIDGVLHAHVPLSIAKAPEANCQIVVHFLFHVGTVSWAEVCVTLACNFLNEVHAKLFLVAKKNTSKILHLFLKPFD
jgi:hypothetical protein